MTTDVLDHPRHVYEVDLRPVAGSTFQPTGFPDIGAATFDRWEGDGDAARTVDCLMVESVQSMANRLEATAWLAGERDQHPLFAGLPYVRVVREGTDEFLTSSRLEAHRLASAFVRDSTLDGKPMLTEIVTRLDLAADRPLDYPRMASAVARLDPFNLIHGVFFSDKGWMGQPKFPRAVSAVVEAYDVRRAVSGGRKSDSVRFQIAEGKAGAAEGYGSVPFHRTEWTARRIVASYVVDAELLSSYGLGRDATELLVLTAMWEVRTMLSRGMRLRTACDLEMVDEEPRTRRGRDLPGLDETESRIRELVGRCGDVLGGGGPLTVRWSSKKADARKPKA